MIRARVKDGALSIISATEWSKELAKFEGKEVEITVREKTEMGELPWNKGLDPLLWTPTPGCKTRTGI